MPVFFSVTAFALAASVRAAAPPAQEVPAAGSAPQQFQQRIDSYMALRHRVARSVPPVKVSPDPERIQEAVETLAAAIRTARRGAEPDEILTTEIGLWFRMLIRDALRESSYDVDDLLADLDAEVPPEATMPAIVINGPFPWAFGAATPPCILAALPVLPSGLQYRFLGRDLVLVDIGASLIVDILRDALPPGDAWPGNPTPGSARLMQARNDRRQTAERAVIEW